MSSLTKADMAERLFDELGLNKREAKDMVESFFEEIRAALAANEHVKLSGFGNFDLRDKRQRPGRNPKTGEDVITSYSIHYTKLYDRCRSTARAISSTYAAALTYPPPAISRRSN